MRKLELNLNDGVIGFQIAPMIDVVFVIMLFFMVMAGSVKTEREQNCRLPGTVDTTKDVPFADEQIIAINARGEVLLNEDPIGQPDDRRLENLRATLKRIKANCDAAKQPAVVVVASEPDAKHGRTIDVVDAISEAEITNLSFTLSSEE